MNIKDVFIKSAQNLLDYCDYPAVKYKILLHLFDKPCEYKALMLLRNDFLYSDIVEELYHEQNNNGGWGYSLQSKDYSVNHKFPASLVGINRCLYIGLSLEDRDILISAYNYLEDFLRGTNPEKLHNKNERDIPWQTATICNAIEAIKPNNELCDRTYNEWLYIAECAFAGGEYSYERERKAQHEVFYTREDRLVPLQFELLLKRRENIPQSLENAMLYHYGEHAYYHGHFWSDCPAKLPEKFMFKQTRRWMQSFNYINNFKGSSYYLSESVEWLLENLNADGLWDWGTQTKDPWGYFGYFSTNRSYSHNRVVDCSMEILCFLKKYIDNNKEETYEQT